MPQQSTQFDFGDSHQPQSTFELCEMIIEDRGSRYSVSWGRVESCQDIKDFLTRLKQNKKYANATHNT